MMRRGPGGAFWEARRHDTRVVIWSLQCRTDNRMAVRVGFEPTEPAKVQRFSRPPDSTALAPHRIGRVRFIIPNRPSRLCSHRALAPAPAPLPRPLSPISYTCLVKMISSPKLPLLLVLLAWAFCPACGRRAPQIHTLSIAAAADLQFALQDASGKFHKAHPGIELRIVYGSSGNFYTQIRSRAPFDVFLSADVQYPRQLVQEGLARADSLFVYAVGRLAVWVPASSRLDPATALRD